jgi:hypothetical protein
MACIQRSKSPPDLRRLLSRSGGLRGPLIAEADTQLLTVPNQLGVAYNDALYDSLPVTMGYAKVLARVVKRMNGLGSAPYQFRFFM